MSAYEFNIPVANLGDITHRLFRIAAQVRGSIALVDTDGNGHEQATAWLLERTENDLLVLASQVDDLFLKGGEHV